MSVRVPTDTTRVRNEDIMRSRTRRDWTGSRLSLPACRRPVLPSGQRWGRACLPDLLPLHDRVPEDALVGACSLLLHLEQRVLAPFRYDADLSGQVFVFTGFRDDVLAGRISNAGGTVAGGVSRKVTTLLVEDHQAAPTGKVRKAVDYGIPIRPKRDFEREFYIL